jgi:hypothetical protein
MAEAAAHGLAMATLVITILYLLVAIVLLLIWKRLR